jgi:transcriptional regulator GlxA family with amidase domain
VDDAGAQLVGDRQTALKRAGLDGGDQPDHVMAYIDRRLADPRLSRASIAAAHRMSPRTLDRLFGGLPWSVSGYIRQARPAAPPPTDP